VLSQTGCQLHHLFLKHQYSLCRNKLHTFATQCFSSLKELHLLHVAPLDDRLLEALVQQTNGNLRKFSVSVSQTITARGLRSVARMSPKLEHLTVDSMDFQYFRLTNGDILGVLRLMPLLRKVSLLGAVDLSPSTAFKLRRDCPRLEEIETCAYQNLNAHFQQQYNQSGVQPFLNLDPAFVEGLNELA
jgi:uncharacterized protein YaeQ